jgi:hypothetical protein
MYEMKVKDRNEVYTKRPVPGFVRQTVFHESYKAQCGLMQNKNRGDVIIYLKEHEE